MQVALCLILTVGAALSLRASRTVEDIKGGHPYNTVNPSVYEMK